MSACEDAVRVGLLRWIDPQHKDQGCVGTQRLRGPDFIDRERLIAAGNMSGAWATRQSGYAGPLVLQMV